MSCEVRARALRWGAALHMRVNVAALLCQCPLVKGARQKGAVCRAALDGTRRYGIGNACECPVKAQPQGLSHRASEPYGRFRVPRSPESYHFLWSRVVVCWGDDTCRPCGDTFCVCGLLFGCYAEAGVGGQGFNLHHHILETATSEEVRELMNPITSTRAARHATVHSLLGTGIL